MQLRSIFIVILLFFCIHDHVRAIPVQQNEDFPSKYNNNTGELKSRSSSKTCLNQKDCSIHSSCIEFKCVCDKGWTTPKDSEECLYQQKPIWTTFYISIFAGYTGADWFYLARGNAVYIVAGVFKLLLFLSCCCSICSFRDKNSVGVIACIYLISRFMSFFSVIWWLVDWIRILNDTFPDGNGMPLYS
jgi:hypothetical protein